MCTLSEELYFQVTKEIFVSQENQYQEYKQRSLRSLAYSFAAIGVVAAVILQSQVPLSHLPFKICSGLSSLGVCLCVIVVLASAMYIQFPKNWAVGVQPEKMKGYIQQDKMQGKLYEDLGDAYSRFVDTNDKTLKKCAKAWKFILLTLCTQVVFLFLFYFTYIIGW